MYTLRYVCTCVRYALTLVSVYVCVCVCVCIGVYVLGVYMLLCVVLRSESVCLHWSGLCESCCGLALTVFWGTSRARADCCHCWGMRGWSQANLRRAQRLAPVCLSATSLSVCFISHCHSLSVLQLQQGSAGGSLAQGLPAHTHSKARVRTHAHTH